MNILLINDYAIAPHHAGGTRHFSLARALVGMGHRVVIAASCFDHVARSAGPAGGAPVQRESVEGVEFIRLRTPPYGGNGAGRLWNMLAFARGVRKVLPSCLDQVPDVVVGSSPHPFGARAGMRLARKMGVPFVLEIRDVWPQSLTEIMGVSRFHPIIWVLARLERELYRGADHIITLLPRVARRVAEKGGDPGAVTWVPNGIDLAMVPPLSDPPEKETFTFMYAGAHGVANALDVVLDAAALLRARAPGPVSLVLVGTGPEKPRLEARARALGLANVTFRPPVPKHEIYGVLAQADAFLASSWDSELWAHGISYNKIFDYMAMARPTLIGLRCSSSPILLSEGGITVKPGDAAAMAEGMERMIAMGRAGRREMGRRARAFVEQNFDIRGLARGFESALVAAGRGHVG